MIKLEPDRITGTEAAIAWLDERPHASKSTQASYRGEANRFCEFLAAHGALLVADFTEKLWDDYLRGLTSARDAVGSRRKNALRPSSALQAARITRSFLAFCHRRCWLSWSPNMAPRACPRLEPRPAIGTTATLSRIVLESTASEDEVTARRRCAISLTFWAGLKPRELAALTCEDLVTRPDGTGSLHVEGRQESAECSTELVAVILAYRQARLFTTSRSDEPLLESNSPLLTRLRSSDAISPHSAWQLVRVWQEDGEAEPSSLGSKVLRDNYALLAGSDAAYALNQVALQTGRTTAAGAGSALPSTTVRIDRVRQRLIEARAHE